MLSLLTVVLAVAVGGLVGDQLEDLEVVDEGEDLESRTHLQVQAGHHVAPLHQQQALAVDLLLLERQRLVPEAR